LRPARVQMSPESVPRVSLPPSALRAALLACSLRGLRRSDAFYASILAVVEGKYWGRNLDVYTKKEDQRETDKQTSSPETE
jgi:hypothetical protein